MSRRGLQGHFPSPTHSIIQTTSEVTSNFHLSESWFELNSVLYKYPDAMLICKYTDSLQLAYGNKKGSQIYHTLSVLYQKWTESPREQALHPAQTYKPSDKSGFAPWSTGIVGAVPAMITEQCFCTLGRFCLLHHWHHLHSWGISVTCTKHIHPNLPAFGYFP